MAILPLLDLRDRDRIAATLRAWSRRALLEQGTLFASLVKWTFLASIVGVLAGASTAVFLRSLELGVRTVARCPYPLVLLPVGFVAAHLLVRVLAPQAEGHGTEKIIEAVHRRWGRIPLLVAPVKLAATVATIAVGGSVGKEGPAAQIGAALASGLASALWLRRRDRRKLVICGIGAGFAAVFGTPIAGAIFGVEVLVMGSLFYEVLYPSFIAGIVSYQVAARLGIRYFHQSLSQLPPPTGPVFLKTLVGGVLFALTALLLIEILHATGRFTARVRVPAWALAASGGSALALLAWLVSPRYLGLGLDTIEDAVRGAHVPPAAFLLKMLFTAISLGTGGSGGIVTPIFFVGATAGATLGTALGFQPGVFAGIGMVSVLAGATNAPIAASIMAIELFGPALGPFAALACVVSFLMVGHRSVYGSQLLGAAKTPSIRLSGGAGLDRIETMEIRRTRSRYQRLWRRFRDRRRARSSQPS
jgi:H+/Cl- antiporter ClcA